MVALGEGNALSSTELAVAEFAPPAPQTVNDESRPACSVVELILELI